MVDEFMELPEAFKHWLLARGYKNEYVASLWRVIVSLCMILILFTCSVMIEYTTMDCIKFAMLSELKEEKIEDDVMQVSILSIET